MTYTIKDVSEMTGLSIYTLRFYDKEGLLPFVSRTKSGIRAFTESDISQIKTICCLKNTGMQLKDIRLYIEYTMEGSGTIIPRKQLLTDHRQVIVDQINQLTENLKLVDAKLDVYNSPYAKDIINEQIRNVNEEKKENCLLSAYREVK